MNKTVSESMTTGLLTIQPSAPIAKAYATMNIEGVRHLLVSDQQNFILGMISERDVERAMNASGFSDAAIVADYMSEHLEVIEAKALLTEAIDKILDLKISALAVKDGNEIIGIVTTDDLIKVLHEVLEHRAPLTTLKQWVSKPPVTSVINFLSEIGI